MKINRIVIVGGGTAGWSTAHHFLNKTRPNVKITVVASKEIPIIGVGESTTGRFNDLINLAHNVAGITEKEFLKETESTFKIGIKHTDWHTVGKSFPSPLGDNFENQYLYPHEDYDFYRIYHIAKDYPYNKTMQSKCMLENKLYFSHQRPDLREYYRFAPIAYHLDTYKVGQYLKKKALTLKDRINYVDDVVEDFEQDENGYVTSIKTKSGQKIEGDLFVDCSGFAKVLINKIEKNNFVSYKDNLLVNSAISFNVKHKDTDPIPNYTHVWAQKYGWLWQIPTQKRMGSGYVFDDNYINFDQAKEEIEGVLGHEIEVQRKIKFEAGRLEKFWIKNVISTGLSSAFIEPLEATSIHATMLQITHFIENYYKEDMPFECELLHKKYNGEMTAMWDYIRDFIVAHYITPRNDTDFWVEASSEKRWPDKLKENMEIWKYRMPRVVDYIYDKQNNFYSIGNTLWYHIFIGMKMLNPKIAKQELIDYGLWDKCIELEKNIENDVNNHIPHFIDNREYYKNL